jgi:hypothetical protein
MIAYLSSADSLTAVLTSAATATQPDYTVVYKHEDGTFRDVSGALNDTTAVTVLAGPSAPGVREVVSVDFYNRDTVAAVLTYAKVQNSTSYTRQAITLQPGDNLHIDDRGVRVTDSSGNARIIRTGYTVKVANRAKAGTTAGWTVAAGNNIGTMATVAASQTNSTLVVPIDGLHVGDTITGFSVYSSINSAGGAVTLDANLRSLTIAAAASATDASIGSITQVSVSAATASSATKSGLAAVVTAGVQYYLLLTATTAASTTIELDAIEITVTTA